MQKVFLCVWASSNIWARTESPWAHAQGEKRSLVWAYCSTHALQTFEHPALALSPDNSWSIDCYARPCNAAGYEPSA